MHEISGASKQSREFYEGLIRPSGYSPGFYAYQESTAHFPAQPQAAPTNPVKPDKTLQQAIARLGEDARARAGQV